MSIRAQYFGQPYPDTPRYYWVDALLPCCAGPVLGPAPVMSAEHLDQNNVVLCQWDPVPGAVGYLLLCSDEASMPAYGDSCVVTRTGATSFSDAGGTLTEYPAFQPPERPTAGKTFEVTIAKPSPRPDRRQTDPEVARAKEEVKAQKAKEDFKSTEHHQTKK